MAKVKIEVPEEFNVFVEKAVDILDSFNRDEKTLGNILEDMAKFRYYLRGRTDELLEISKSDNLPSEIFEQLVEKLDALRKLDNHVNIIFNALINPDTNG